MRVTLGTINIDNESRKNVNKVLDSGRLSYGQFSKKLEQDFAKIHQCKYAVLSNSGTSSLHVAIQALKELHHWRDGDEIIVPATTFVATINTIIHNRLKPVLVDVELFTYGINPTLIEEKITPKTRAIIPVHLFGQICLMEKIMSIAKKHKLKVIEDSCECMFTKRKGISTGNFGDISCFSTYMAHLLTTGVGGLCLTNNPKYAVKIRSLVNHGRDSIYISIDDDKKTKGNAANEVIAKRFKFDSIGHSFRITELESALGVAQLKNWQTMIKKRNENANTLTEELLDMEFSKNKEMRILLPFNIEQHAYMMYPILFIGDKISKQKVVEYLEKNGIETRDMLPLINQPCYKHLNLKQSDYPISKQILQRGFYVGCHQGMGKKHMKYLANKIREAIYKASS